MLIIESNIIYISLKITPTGVDASDDGPLATLLHSKKIDLQKKQTQCTLEILTYLTVNLCLGLI